MSALLQSHTKGGIEVFNLPVYAAGDDLAVLQYTGGTTGLSKGAMRTGPGPHPLQAGHGLRHEDPEPQRVVPEDLQEGHGRLPEHPQERARLVAAGAVLDGL